MGNFELHPSNLKFVYKSRINFIQTHTPRGRSTESVGFSPSGRANDWQWYMFTVGFKSDHVESGCRVVINILVIWINFQAANWWSSWLVFRLL